MKTWKQLALFAISATTLLTSADSYGAGLETLSKKKPEVPATSSAVKSGNPATSQPTPVANSAAETVVAPPKAEPAIPPQPTTPTKATPLKNKVHEPTDDEGEETDKASTKAEAKAVVVQSQASKSIEGRLSLASSLGWAIVKPSKGTWIGIGASDLAVRWRESRKGDERLLITGRYAPVSGVWTVNDRDYDTTLHGIYAGAEYQKPLEAMGAATLKAGLELGYMLVYAVPQDKAEASSDVKGGKLNLATGGGLEWGILNDKVKFGPFARLHFAGFTILNLGGSINFVF